MSLTGHKDTDREILKHIDDKQLLTICRLDSKTWNSVCDDAFIKRRLAKYPGIEKYKKGNESWKAFFLRVIYDTARMKEQFQFEYSDGDFSNQYDLLKKYRYGKLLLEAARRGELSVVKYAIRKRIFYRDDLNNALHIASENGVLPIVEYLIEQGAYIHSDEDRALYIASSKGRLDVVKYLVEHGANIHTLEDNPLRLAAEKGHLPVVKYLVEHGANINAENGSALRRARINGYTDVVNYLTSR